MWYVQYVRYQYLSIQVENSTQSRREFELLPVSWQFFNFFGFLFTHWYVLTFLPPLQPSSMNLEYLNTIGVRVRLDIRLVQPWFPNNNTSNTFNSFYSTWLYNNVVMQRYNIFISSTQHHGIGGQTTHLDQTTILRQYFAHNCFLPQTFG